VPQKRVSEEAALDAIGAYERTKDIKTLHNNVIALATCQIGSKFLQRIFSRSIKLLDEALLAEILINIDRLMVD